MEQVLEAALEHVPTPTSAEELAKEGEKKDGEKAPSTTAN